MEIKQNDCEYDVWALKTYNITIKVFLMTRVQISEGI